MCCYLTKGQTLPGVSRLGNFWSSDFPKRTKIPFLGCAFLGVLTTVVLLSLWMNTTLQAETASIIFSSLNFPSLSSHLLFNHFKMTKTIELTRSVNVNFDDHEKRQRDLK